MPNWFIKATIQGVLSMLPGSQNLNYFFQRNISRGLILKEPYFETKVAVARQHLDLFHQYRPDRFP